MTFCYINLNMDLITNSFLIFHLSQTRLFRYVQEEQNVTSSKSEGTTQNRVEILQTSRLQKKNIALTTDLQHMLQKLQAPLK